MNTTQDGSGRATVAKPRQWPRRSHSGAREPITSAVRACMHRSTDLKGRALRVGVGQGVLMSNHHDPVRTANMSGFHSARGEPIQNVWCRGQHPLAIAVDSRV